MDPRMIMIALHEMKEIGWKTIFKLLQQFADLGELMKATQLEMEQWGIPTTKAQVIREHLTENFINSKMAAYKEHNVEIVTIYDEAYPTLLKQTSQPPWVLYCKGNIQLMQLPLIAIVGTRVPTVYGKNVAQQLAVSLARNGFGVVSGLARGIDSSAHLGALNEIGGTIAVLGCGIDVIYPLENSFLYREIALKGLIISEYPLGMKSHPGLFPLRNRIIAGLSLGTVVVEAALKSGSLITADQAMDESRDVFAVPGQINSPKSQGTLALIKQGAKVVICAEDIIEEYKHLLYVTEHTNIKAIDDTSRYELNGDEQRIFDLLTLESLTFDQLIEQSQTNFGHLHTILLSLLMKKKINQLPGSTYSIH
jgi:DNA processing protein